MTSPWVAILALPFLLAAAAIGRIALALPALMWSLMFVGAAAGWWGSGLGDGWVVALAAAVAAGTLAAAAGLALRPRITGGRRETDAHLRH
jgi:hypothetical protein